MEKRICLVSAIVLALAFTNTQAQQKAGKLFIDVHVLRPGSITAADVASAHVKDLAVQAKHHVQFLKYWVNEKEGTIYCLSSAPDSAHIADAHNEAHGLVPQQVYTVTEGMPAVAQNGLPYFLDIHNLGAGNVTAAAVAAAHKKDVAVQKKFGVNFINYWVCEDRGIVFCLSQTKNIDKIAETHKRAHGLIPATVVPVAQGQ